MLVPVDVSSGGLCSGIKVGRPLWVVFLFCLAQWLFCFFVRVSQLSGLFGVLAKESCVSLSCVGGSAMLCSEDGSLIWGLFGLGMISWGLEG